jgi:type IV pilus assembly protein PilP
MGFLLILSGCQEKAAEPEKKSQVVSQKISAKTQKIEPQKPKAATPSPVAEPGKPTSQTPQTGVPVASTTAPKSSETYETGNLIPDMSMGYDPVGRIDPFVPLVRDEPIKVEKQEAVQASAEVKPVRQKTPLEKIELSQLRLRAIIIAASGNRALVEETTGKGYIITKGTYIGRNDGKITKILKDKVIIEEMIEDIEGKMVIQEKEIKLPKPPGEE